jgi:DNA-binding GntR family transcriptional regulator
MLPVARRTLTDAAADALRERILRGGMAAGTPLRQEAIARELGVSRIPLREAFLRLEAEGLVALLPHRGAVVAELPLDDVAELFELRASLESDLIRRAVPRLQAADHAMAKQRATAFADALANEDLAALGEANLQFHAALYATARRPRTLEVVTRLHGTCDRLLRLQLTLTDGGARAIREHRTIAAAARRGDAERAAELTREHILGAGRRLAAALATHQEHDTTP